MRSLLLLALVANLVSATASFSVPVYHREVDADTVAALRKRQSAVTANKQRRITLWFANFTVGDSSGLDLLLDTGSTDLLLDPGLYVKSPSAKRYQKAPFNITYEGVNKAGTGFENILGTVYSDKVSLGDLTVPHQPFGNITTYSVQDAPPKKTAIAGDGIIGFATSALSSFVPQSNSWFYNLCDLKLISECRIGFAFGTAKKGLQVVGTVDKTLFKGEMGIAPLQEVSQYPFWTIKGDISINDKLFYPNQTLIMDTGTTNIQGPQQISEEIFRFLGYPISTSTGGPNPVNPGTNITFVSAYFPCDKPPTMRFSFPAKATLADPPAGEPISQTVKTITLAESTWSVKDNGNNNCTAVLAGTNDLYNPVNHTHAWLIGQPLYQGHYVDHQIAGAVGFADLVDPVNPGGM